MKKRVGIMGGTFDPVHYGHLMIAHNACEQFDMERVMFIPTGTSPHKDDSRITEAVYRCRMIALAIKGNPKFELSTREIVNTQVSYTYRTLSSLKEEEPDTEFYFILGGDSLFQFESWVNPDIICENATLVVAARDDMEKMKLHRQIEHITTEIMNADIRVINCPAFDISSKLIRQRVADGESIKYFLPPAVEEYILHKGLYREERSVHKIGKTK
jgi:nicotinate-nucleotide adenylyltransferase